MLLYQPSEQEIDAAVAKAKANFPALASRMDKAGEYLGDVAAWQGWTDKETIWALPSQSQVGREYFVENGTRCTCEDYRSHKALCDGQPVCKHVLAVRAYKWIVGRRLQAQIEAGEIAVVGCGRGQYQAKVKGAPWLAGEFRVWRKVEYRQAGYGIGNETGPFRFKSDWDLKLYAERLAMGQLRVEMPAAAKVAVALPQMQMAEAAD